MAQARRWVATDFGGPEVLDLVTVELPEPGPGEVTIEVRAAGMNPADYKGFARGDRASLPRPVGSEVAGVLAALGPDTEIASGGGAVGDEVLAFRIAGGYASAVTVPAADVFAKPAALDFPAAANLLLAGATAADTLRAVKVGAGETILVHGASGAVGVSILQQARLLGALAVGTDEAVDVSVELVADRDRIVTIAAIGRAGATGIRSIGGGNPDSAAFRAAARPRLIQLAGAGELVVPIARTFPLAEARQALDLLMTGHPGGKLALLP